MARRKKNSANVIEGLTTVFAAIFFVIRKLVHFGKAPQRRESLLEKFHDEEVVSKLIRREIWIGETAVQLRESLGEPEDINFKNSGSNIKEIWKYDRRGKNRYGLRVTLDNGIVREINRTGHD